MIDLENYPREIYSSMQETLLVPDHQNLRYGGREVCSSMQEILLVPDPQNLRYGGEVCSSMQETLLVPDPQNLRYGGGGRGTSGHPCRRFY